MAVIVMIAMDRRGRFPKLGPFPIEFVEDKLVEKSE